MSDRLQACVGRRGKMGVGGALVMMLLLGACGGAAEDDGGSPPSAAQDGAVEGEGVADAIDEAVDDAAGDAAPAEIEVCALVTIEEVGALLEDEIREPRAEGARGHVLGACSWSADNNGRSLSIGALPVSMWDQLVEPEGTETVADLGARAAVLEGGELYVDPGDAPYVLQVIFIDTDGSVNLELATDAALLAMR